MDTKPIWVDRVEMGQRDQELVDQWIMAPSTRIQQKITLDSTTFPHPRRRLLQRGGLRRRLAQRRRQAGGQGLAEDARTTATTGSGWWGWWGWWGHQSQ